MANKAIARAKQTAQRISTGRKFMGSANEGSLASRPAAPTAPQQTTNDSNEINDLFQGLRQQATPRGYRRPIVRRGMSGQELNPDGSDPGRGMAWFDRNNSEAQVNERQARVGRDDARRYAQINQQGSAAVAERKALQGMGGAPFQQQNPNLVKGNDGYMDLFGQKGEIVGSTRPQSRVQGFGDPSNTNLEAQRASQGMQDSFQQNFRVGNAQSAMPPNAGPQFPQQAPPQPRGDFLTPGGGGGATVGGSPPQGAPAGGTPRPGGIAPVDWMSGLDTSSAPKFQMPTQPVIPGEMDTPSAARNFNASFPFRQQISDKLDSERGANVPLSNPFVGAPYGGKLNGRQEEILGLFAPKSTGGFLGAPKPLPAPVSGNTNAFNTIFPGQPGQLNWPMIQNEDVKSFEQFFPGMNWDANFKDSSRQQIQNNFDMLLAQGLIRIGSDGNYQLIPQYPLEQMLQSY